MPEGGNIGATMAAFNQSMQRKTPPADREKSPSPITNTTQDVPINNASKEDTTRAEPAITSTPADFSAERDLTGKIELDNSQEAPKLKRDLSFNPSNFSQAFKVPEKAELDSFNFNVPPQRDDFLAGSYVANNSLKSTKQDEDSHDSTFRDDFTENNEDGEAPEGETNKLKIAGIILAVLVLTVAGYFVFKDVISPAINTPTPTTSAVEVITVRSGAAAANLNSISTTNALTV